MTSSNRALKADTYGWDTVFAIHVEDVNATIKRKGSSPGTFKSSTVDPMSGVGIEVSGIFDHWRITPGGSGKLIHMATPVTFLKASAYMPEQGAVNFTYGPGTFEIEVELEYVSLNETPDNSTGTFHNLIVRSARTIPDEQVVTVLDAYDFGNSTDGSDTPFDSVSDDVKAAMQTWFNEHLVDFSHIFATVNLNRTADNGQFSWLLPTYTSYAYIDGDTPEKSILGILCMTEGRSAKGLDTEISPNAIPPDASAGFLIAPERFLTKMIWPSMPLVYKGAQSDDFMLTSDTSGLTLARGPVTIASLTDDDGRAYTTTLKNFQLSTTDQLLTIDAVTRVEVSPGIEAYSHTVSSYGLTLHTESSGKQSIYYVELNAIPAEHWTEVSEGVQITRALIGVVAGLITIAVGVAAGGAGFAAAALVTGILAGTGSLIPDIIAAANTDSSPSIDMLVFNAVDPLQWTDQADFVLENVALNYAVQLGAKPSYIST